MIRIKTLTFPLISALVAALSVPASAQVSLDISSNKTYRQNKKGIFFRGGEFTVDLTDGSAFYVGGCAAPYYLPLGTLGCPGGTTAFLTRGQLDGVETFGPYYWISSITQGRTIEPRRPNLVFLRAAPASTLPRPAGGFADESFTLSYNLHTTEVRDYTITRYAKFTDYSRRERKNFESDIVPGAYHYSFPRLGYPNLVAPITATIFPMVEGIATKSNKTQGFRFLTNDNRWTKKGFMELSFLKPNTIRWEGLEPNVVYPSVDALYFSIRVMQDPTNPNSNLDLVDNDVGGAPQSVFPAFASGGDPRALLRNSFVDSYTTPPIFEGGTKGVLEVEVQRTFPTGGVAYDFSDRKFQVPVMVVNRYTDYQEVFFEGKGNKAILEDPDRDGYNNLNEWILDSNGNEAGSIPVAPLAGNNPIEFDFESFQILRYQYYGFTIRKKLATVPKVKYILQRSKDEGRTWTKFVTDGDWNVTTVRKEAGAPPGRERDPARVEIRVESRWGTDGELLDFPDFPGFEEQGMPPGTGSDLYRVKIVSDK